MDNIPVEARAFLSTNDSLAQAQLAQQFPNLQDTLRDPGVRAAVLAWLASDAAWDDANAHFTLNALRYLRSAADPAEAQVIRPFLLHSQPGVRLAAYEFLLTLYYPDKNREALLQLLQNMLSDSQDAIRSAGARYADQADVEAELHSFLLRWQKTAEAQGWVNSESFELVGRLLNA